MDFPRIWTQPTASFYLHHGLSSNLNAADCVFLLTPWTFLESERSRLRLFTYTMDFPRIWTQPTASFYLHHGLSSNLNAADCVFLLTPWTFLESECSRLRLFTLRQELFVLFLFCPPMSVAANKKLLMICFCMNVTIAHRKLIHFLINYQV